MENHNNNNQTDDHRKTVGEWLERSFVWRIPVYQRHYAWDAASEFGPIHLFWDTVKEQTLVRLQGGQPAQHYLGAVLVDKKMDRHTADGITRLDVVDGQQRLTTIQIAMLSLIWTAGEHGCGSEIKETLEKYVFADKANNRPRLLPTNFDNKQFQTVLFDAYDVVCDVGAQNVSRDNANKSKIRAAFEFFKERHNELATDRPQSETKRALRAIMETLVQGFDLVLILLRESDDAQRVFESLNNYAKPLTTFDLIRNNVFHRAASIHPGMDEALFAKDAWQQLEKPYWEGKADNQKVNWTTHIEAYVARMLVAKMRKGMLFNRNSIFRTYKEFCNGFSSIDEEIGSLVDYVDVYQYLDADMGRNPAGDDVDFGVFRHAVWKNRDFYPALFLIARCDADAEQKRRMLMLLESYVVRRGVCGLSSGHYNQHVVAICTALGDEPGYEVLAEVLKNAEKNTTVFPDDERVMRDCVTEKFYRSPFQEHVFKKIEKSMSIVGVEDIVVEGGNLTIDHILPQGWEANPEWKQIVLGNDGGRDDAAALTVNSYLHTIGNLTMMSGKNNTVKSNQPFEKVKGLLAASELKLNRELAEEEAWNVEKIAARSRKLAGKICEIWPYDVA